MAEDPLSATRAKVLMESLEKTNTRGWGYFGVSGPLCIGDNSYTPVRQRKTEEEQEALTTANVTTRPLLKGSGVDVYFSFSPPLANGDPYKDPHEINKKGRVTYLDPEAVFKPAKHVSEPVNKLGYEYEPHKDNLKDPKEVYAKYKDVLPARQIYTCAAKKGGGGVYTKGVLFGLDEERQFYEYKEDPYDGAKQQRAKELKEHLDKMPEAPFKGMEYGNKPFHADDNVFHYDVPTHVPRAPKPDNVNVYPHEAPFFPARPAKKGAVYGLIAGHPEWVAEPAHGGAVRKPKDDGEEKQPFKLANPRTVRHLTPSVVTMTRNLRAERPSSFARPVL